MRRCSFRVFLALAILIVTNFACRKDSEQYMSNGAIIGYDLRMCACCGGTEITIDNVQNPNGNPYFLVGKFPSSFKMGDNPKFPIALKLDWKILPIALATI